MSDASTWMVLLGGAFAVGVVLLMWPNIKRNQARRRKGETKEWMNVAFILGLVVLFVSLLIFMAQG